MPRTFYVAVLCLAQMVTAKTVPLDKLWQIDVPDDWWYAEAENDEGLRIYTFGCATPDPLQEPPILLADPKTSKAYKAKLVRGISMGIARKLLETISVEGELKFIREGKAGLLVEGYRKEVETVDGKMFLAAFAFTAEKLPGDPPIAQAAIRKVIVHIAGKSKEELEAFMKVFDSIRVWHPPLK